MQYNSLLNNFWTRILIGFIGGIVFRFPVDVIIGLSFRNYTVDNFLSYYLLAIVSSIFLFYVYHLLNQVLDKKYDWHTKTKKRFWNQLFIQFLLGLVIMLMFRYLFDFLVLRKNFYLLTFEVLSAVVIIFTITAYNLVELGFYLLNNSRYSLAELERFKKENAEFRFETLMNQVNPHFLFNSLNTLSSLVYEDQDTAAKYIRELARVYRYVLENKENELVILKVDIDFVKAYIYLLELRFKDMISFEFDIDDYLLERQIAPMTIQMLIENAVKHNIVSKKKHLKVKIYTKSDYLIVANNVQKKPAKSYSSGIGLNNIQSRYAYFTQNQVNIIETANEFLVEIPLIEQSDGNQ